MKTPLRYPGGKSRAVKHILPLIPEDCGELCSPFLGGGSVELAVAERGAKVHAYDAFEPLVWFWQALLAEPLKLAILCDGLRVERPEYILKDKQARGLPKEVFMRLREELRGETQYSIVAAAMFYAINRSSFSGATFSGGFSKRASYARFTDSSIKRVKDFTEPNLKVEHADFQVSIPRHPDAFLYLDPPYMLGEERDKLYGDGGNTHAGFNHQSLHKILTERDRWVMSYNDCKQIREMYKDYEIREAAWAYGMNKSKESSEILIIGS